MPLLNKEKYIKAVMGVDGAIALLFGMVSLFFPREVFSSLVNLSGVTKNSLIFSAFTSISIFYIFTGILCIYFVRYIQANIVGFAILMTVYHLSSMSKNIIEIHADWLIGNPWPDICIHFGFSALYVVYIVGRPKPD